MHKTFAPLKILRCALDDKIKIRKTGKGRSEFSRVTRTTINESPPSSG
ncbi:MAG: hypothetical protein WAO23_00355 [Dethiobacteria bacterium]